jgi:hypothetical protein
MRNALARIERLEDMFGMNDCICRAREQQVAIIVVQDSWCKERRQFDKESVRFNCPTHGLQYPAVVLELSPSDVGA